MQYDHLSPKKDRAKLIAYRVLKEGNLPIPHDLKVEVEERILMELVYYWADWCKFCKMAGPAIERVAADTGVPLRKVDQDEAKVPDVQGLPTVVLLRDGVEAARVVGAKSTSGYKAALFKG